MRPGAPRVGSSLRIVVTDDAGRPLRRAGLARWLARIAPPRARGTLGVALVSDARIRALNRRYRRTDRVTDVLSFPLSNGHDRSRVQSPGSRVRVRGALGDIVIARGRAARQAREAGHPVETELRLLALHGLLHLLGYDHARDRGRMARAERRLRRRGGLREGLIERQA